MTTTTTIAVPTSCAALCTKLAELVQRIDDQLAQAASGSAIDYGALEQRVADALGEVERGLHAQVLARLDIDVPAIRVWGDEYRFGGAFGLIQFRRRHGSTGRGWSRRDRDPLDPDPCGSRSGITRSSGSLIVDRMDLLDRREGRSATGALRSATAIER